MLYRKWRLPDEAAVFALEAEENLTSSSSSCDGGPPAGEPVYSGIPQSEKLVTVCVAAICGGGATIIGASDRMLSALAQYQSPERKTYGLTSSIVAMWAGDASFHALILHELKAEVDRRINAAPNDWLEVRQVAYLYQWFYNQARRRVIEQSVLAPLGLDTTSFLSQQQALAPHLVERIVEGMRGARTPGVQALIVGMDNTGAHIYEFENFRSPGDVSCHDAVGFAAIGSGSYQAASQFMLAAHGPSRPIEETMFLTYLAKKRSQVAPGVGEATDMFIFGGAPGRPGYYQRLRDDIYPVLEDAYKQLQEAEALGMDKAQQVTQAYLATLTKPPVPAGQASGPSGPLGPASDPASSGATGPTGPTPPSSPVQPRDL